MQGNRKRARRAIAQTGKLHRKMSELADHIHSGGQSALTVHIGDESQSTTGRALDHTLENAQAKEVTSNAQNMGIA
jgi:hypothetical protein